MCIDTHNREGGCRQTNTSHEDINRNRHALNGGGGGGRHRQTKAKTDKQRQRKRKMRDGQTDKHNEDCNRNLSQYLHADGEQTEQYWNLHG